MVTDYYIQVRRSATGICTVTLPAITTVDDGAVFIISDSGYGSATYNITVARTGSDKINNVAGSYTISQNGTSLTFVANETTLNWEISIDSPLTSSATFITQTASGALSNEQALSTLATGLMQVTTTTGVISSITTSADVATVISDETGSGALVFANTPTLITPKVTVGATAVPIGASMKVSTTAVGNVTTGEDTLITYDLPAASLASANDYVEVEAWGTYANNINAKTVKLYFGAVVISTKALTTSINGTWSAKGKVFRTGAATQDVFGLLTEEHEGTGIISQNITTATETLSSAITIKCTGEATDTDDVVQEGLIVRWYPGN